MERIFKLGIGVERPGEVVFEAKLQAEDAQGFANQLQQVWSQESAKVQNHSEEDVFLHLMVNVDDTGWSDFDLEDEVLGLLDPARS